MTTTRNRRTTLPCLGLGGLGLLVPAGCAGAEQPASETALPVVALGEDPGLEHVHGLGVNPAEELVHLSRDGGPGWAPVGDVGGLPEALLDTGERLYVAADRALQISQDDGASWQLLLDYH